MSAEVLRRAAALMRERAEAATGDRWGWRHFGDDPEAPCRVVYYPPDLADPWEIVADDIFAEGDAEHIASWHPAVALAVADWLDEEAQKRPSYGHGGVLIYGPSDHALRVARAYLGEDSP